MKQILAILAGFLVPHFSLTAQLSLVEIEGGHLLAPQQMELLIDSTQGLAFEEVLTSKEFRTYSEYQFVQEVQANYWLKIPLVNDSSRKWVFEVLTPQTEDLSFFHPLQEGYKEIRTGHLHPFDTRSYQHKNFVFNLKLPSDTGNIYLRICSQNKVGFFFKIHTQEAFSNYALLEFWLLGCYYGILALLFMYHLILYFSLRKLVYLFYSITVFIAGLISSSDDGLGVIYIWNGFKEWSQVLGLYVLPLAYLVAFTLYSYTFMGSRFKPIQKLILSATGIYLFIFIIQVFFSQQQVYFSEFYSFPFVAIYGLFLYCYIRFRYKPSLIFLVGFSFSLFGLLVNQLRLLQVIEGNVFTVYAFNLGVVLEFLSMAFSLSYRYKEQEQYKRQLQQKEIRILKEKQQAQQEMMKAVEEKDRATQEINKTLEVKVTKRTQQLTDLINKLKGLNYEYDKENWELRRVVKKEKQAHFTQEKMSVQEIRELFPTNQRCYEFLAELKWKNTAAYLCPRCGHDNYSIISVNYGRKCSRCATTNSVTKDSLYQSLKIPLTKLFYITYLWNKDDKLNVKALADELAISEATLYKFLTRLKDRKKEKLKAKEPVNSWVDLIF